MMGVKERLLQDTGTSSTFGRCGNGPILLDKCGTLHFVSGIRGYHENAGIQNFHSSQLKKITSEVNGFIFVHFYLQVITLGVKVLIDLLMLYIRRYYLLREVV